VRKLLQGLGNVLLYGFLLWLLYGATIKKWDPWFSVVVAFVLVLAIVVTLVPGLHAKAVSPGEYPYEE
jgi:uncharacterized ion transporter superfamily protein YfcC